MDICKKIAEELAISTWQVEAVVRLIDEGNTIPFIARYRKEQHGTLNDEQLRNLDERLSYLRNLEDRKETVLASIEEQGKLTDDLRKQILAAKTQVELEDLYRPYRPKRRTRATIAKEKGLEGLADIILLQKSDRTPEEEAEPYIDAEKGAASAEEAVQGAMDILAEAIADKADYRMAIRKVTAEEGGGPSDPGPQPGREGKASDSKDSGAGGRNPALSWQKNHCPGTGRHGGLSGAHHRGQLFPADRTVH